MTVYVKKYLDQIIQKIPCSVRQGDYGSPLMKRFEGKFFVGGIMSLTLQRNVTRKNECVNVYTNVSYFANWIQKHTNNTSHQEKQNDVIPLITKKPRLIRLPGVHYTLPKLFNNYTTFVEQTASESNVTDLKPIRYAQNNLFG
ncbi:hypothetical protein B4U80_14140 [Leptotrombidium deliense]|uniref:Peptidase S1 domain-containing protein n=1 Tax=Leptotrombidium deliense TaxID=299467 RepID=A0A443S1U2_9ACAR|nr:hypothetical protein B4U80_14140 [Leptotrombidium deliense]